MLVEPFSGESQLRRHIAVIGSGIAGLSAAWLLAKQHRVTLFEVDGRPGGHSHTVLAPTGKTLTPVDTGFIVFNARNYPNLTALFDHIGVETQSSDMSFAASLDGGQLEYSSDGLRGLLGQRSNTVSLRFWTMVRDIWRFYVEAPRLMVRPECEALTLGEYLDRNGYSDAFVEDHLLPMGAAIWSTTAKQMRDYPLLAFVQFFNHHGLLDLVGRPAWRTVKGGSIEYVRRMLARLDDVRLGAGAAQIRRERGGVTVIDTRGERQWFDDVVIATHADQARKLLADADEQEAALLGAFEYTDNLAVLHADPALMPRRERVWSSWNYIGESSDSGERPLCVTYWMNRLQNLDRAHPLFVTLNRRARSRPTNSSAASTTRTRYSIAKPSKHSSICGGCRATGTPSLPAAISAPASTRTPCNRGSPLRKRSAACVAPGRSTTRTTGSSSRQRSRQRNEVGALCGQGVPHAGSAPAAQARLPRILSAARSR